LEYQPLSLTKHNSPLRNDKKNNKFPFKRKKPKKQKNKWK
jgi:hypothetical protein